jgi:hypothetical protein
MSHLIIVLQLDLFHSDDLGLMYQGCWSLTPTQAWDLQRHSDGRWVFYSNGTYLSFRDGTIQGKLTSIVIGEERTPSKERTPSE